MKIQLLIAAAERDYSEYLSYVLSTKYPDTFAVGICSSQEKMVDALSAKRYDIVLGEPEWLPAISGEKVKLVLALWTEQASIPESVGDNKAIRKYQRISSIVSDILEHYAAVASRSGAPGETRGRVIAVWSPAGGVGKSSVALALAARKVSLGRSATYLSFEHFGGIEAYFPGEGKSISSLFEKLSSNADILVESIRQKDTGSGISFFKPPNNYDDINELTIDDIKMLIDVCVKDNDFLIIDLPGVCDKRTQAIFEIADSIYVVSDGSASAEAKIDLFCSQHCVFGDNGGKMRLILNKAASKSDSRFEVVITLPRVQTADPVSVFKTLSGNIGLDQ